MTIAEMEKKYSSLEPDRKKLVDSFELLLTGLPSTFAALVMYVRCTEFQWRDQRGLIPMQNIGVGG
jgi:hypothetical protein